MNYSTTGLNLIGGVYYGKDDTVTDNTFDIGSVLGPGVNGGFYQHFHQARQSYAVFAQGDVNLDQPARPDPRHPLHRRPRPITKTASPTCSPATAAGRPAQVPLAEYPRSALRRRGGDLRLLIRPRASTSKGSNDAPTGRAALSYTFDNGALVYASYNRGYRSRSVQRRRLYGRPRASPLSSRKRSTPSRSAPRRAASSTRSLDVLATAAFYYSYQNQQVQDTRAGPVMSFLVQRAGSPRSTKRRGRGHLPVLVGPQRQCRAGPFERDLSAADVLQSTNLLPATTCRSHRTSRFRGGLDLANGQHRQRRPDLLAVVPLCQPPVFLAVRRDQRRRFAPGQRAAELQQKAYAKVNAVLAWSRDNLTLRAWVDNLLEARTLGYGLDLRGAGTAVSSCRRRRAPSASTRGSASERGGRTMTNAFQPDLRDPRSLHREAKPHDVFARLRREQPVYWNPEADGPGFWALTRYADIVEVSRQPELFSSAHENGGPTGSSTKTKS